MNFTCDVCGREVFSCTFVNGMKFCAKCYQETFGETDKDRKITDLETKLAESENQCRECKHLNKKIELNIKNKLMAENCELQKQLADTEAQNKRVLEKLDIIVRSNQELEKENELMAKTLKMTKFVEKEVNQDKISFALEQLEKVKELCKTKFEWWENSEWEGNIYDKSDVSNAYFDIEANVDNQIEELKKEMK